MNDWNSWETNLPAPADTSNWWNQGGADVGAGVGGFLGNFFNKDPYAAGQPYLNQLPGLYGNTFNPYIQNGQNQIGTLNDQFSRMTSNPGQFLNGIGAGYQQSPGFQFQVNNALTGANRAAAAGGSLGSGANQITNMGLANNLANQDYNQYLQNALGVFNRGQQGQQDFEHQGFGASEDYASAMRSYYQQQAQQAEAAQQAKNQQNSGAFGAVGSIIGGLAHFL